MGVKVNREAHITRAIAPLRSLEECHNIRRRHEVGPERQRDRNVEKTFWEGVKAFI